MNWPVVLVWFVLSFVAAFIVFQVIGAVFQLIGMGDGLWERLPVWRPSVLISAAIVSAGDALLIGGMAGSEFVFAAGRIYWALAVAAWVVYALALFEKADPKTCVLITVAHKSAAVALAMILSALLH